MKSKNVNALTSRILEALSKSNQRGVISSGWGGLKTNSLSENIFCIDSISHDWLFPKMSAVIHHGGSGTTAASLRAGVPAIIVPFVADQPFWGDRIYKLGLGPAPIKQKDLTVETLTSAISAAVNNQDFKIRANRLGQSVKAENGVEQAVKIFNQLV